MDKTLIICYFLGASFSVKADGFLHDPYIDNGAGIESNPRQEAKIKISDYSSISEEVEDFIQDQLIDEVEGATDNGDETTQHSGTETLSNDPYADIFNHQQGLGGRYTYIKNFPSTPRQVRNTYSFEAIGDNMELTFGITPETEITNAKLFLLGHELKIPNNLVYQYKNARLANLTTYTVKLTTTKGEHYSLDVTYNIGELKEAFSGILVKK